MNERNLGRGLAITLALVLSLTLLAAAIWFPATSARVMLPLMRMHAPEQNTGFPNDAYPAMTAMITDYLRGEQDAFQLTFALDGREYLAFQPHEQQHMEDVQLLFRLCRGVLLAGCAGSAMLLAALAWTRSRGAFVWFRRTLLAILAVVTIVIIAACIDFDSLFMLFHQVAFTNDLWLLDPRTDLLIRLMPIEFFISYAAIIGCCWLLGMVAMLVFATVRIKKLQTNEGE